MKKLVYKSSINLHHYYKKDIDRIRKIFFDRGYEITDDVIVLAWKEFSESWCAGWLVLDSFTNDEIFESLFNYFVEEE